MGAPQGPGRFIPLSKVLIMAGLAVAAGAVLYMKGTPSPEPPKPAPPGPAETVQPAAVEKPGLPENVTASLPRLVDLGSDKCQSCKAMVPVLEELTNDYADRLEVVFIDVWKNPDEAVRYGVQLIPTQVFLDSTGKELFRHEGFFSREDILTAWKELGFDFDG